MRAILIDSKTRQMSEVEIPSTYDAKDRAIGGVSEIATQFANGDVLLVDANGFSRYRHFFDVGVHQAFAGPGLIVGAPGHQSAKTSLADAQAMTTYVADYKPREPTMTAFDNIGDALDYIDSRRPAYSAETSKPGIELHYSILDLEDSDLEIVGADNDDGGMVPHLEMFRQSGLTELVSHPTEWQYRITSEGVRWSVPAGVKADSLKAALANGGSLWSGLCATRAAALQDAGLLAACESVTEELDRLGSL